MKALVKKSFLLVALVMISMLFVSCFDDTPFVPYSDIWDWNENGIMYYYYAPNETDQIQIMFSDGQGSSGPILAVYYSTQKGTAFDGIVFEGATKALDENHEVKKITLAEVYGYLPSETNATWTVKFTNSADPSKNFDHTISAEDVTSIKARIDAKIAQLKSN